MVVFGKALGLSKMDGPFHRFVSSPPLLTYTCSGSDAMPSASPRAAAYTGARQSALSTPVASSEGCAGPPSPNGTLGTVFGSIHGNDPMTRASVLFLDTQRKPITHHQPGMAERRLAHG